MIFQKKIFSPKFFKGVPALALILLVYISSISYRHSAALTESTNLYIHSYKVTLELEKLISYLKDAETGQRGFIITEDSVFLQPYYNSRLKTDVSFRELHYLTSDNIIQKNNLDTLHYLIDQRYAFFHAALKNRHDSSTLLSFMLRGNNLMDNIRVLVNKMDDLEKTYLKARKKKYNDETYLTPMLTLGLAFFALLIFMGAYIKISLDFDALYIKNRELLLKTESLNQAERIGNFSTWYYNLETDSIHRSDNYYQLMSHEPQAFEPTVEKFISFVHPEDVKIVQEAREKFLKGTESITVFYRIVRKDGELRYIKSVSQVFPNEQGEKVAIGILSDVTEQHLINLDLEQKNQQLLLSNELLQHAEQIGKFASWMWDKETNKISFSDNYYALLGFEPQSFEITQEKFRESIHPDDLPHVGKASDDLRSQKKDAVTVYYRIFNRNGEMKYIKTLGKVLINSEGKIKNIGTFADVTEERLLNLELEEKNRDLERSNIELASFNHIASHDLQEPLRKIQMSISRLNDLESTHFSPNTKEYLTKINTSATRMRQLIDDLLMFSRVSKVGNLFHTTDLNDLLLKSKIDLAQLIAEKNAEIESTTLPRLKVIPFQIQQLFVNLIGNALKYSKSNSQSIIKISSAKVHDTDYPYFNLEAHKMYYAISVSDNGIGFETEYSDKIFELFYRLPHAYSNYTGTGVGLSICKKIVENHHGFIFAQSQLHIGSKFTFILPENS